MPVTAVESRIGRLDADLAFLGATAAEPSDATFALFTSAFTAALYPPQLAGAVVLEAGADPAESDAALDRPGPGARSIRVLDAGTKGGHWWVGSAPPAPDTFRPPQLNEPLLVGKPTSSCLFTSGGTSSWPGMWSGIAAVERPDRNPLWAWRLEPLESPRELRISGAREWCELVVAYPRRTTRGLVPDWFHVAEDYDAITVTVAAVAATHGIEHAYRDARIAPTFWDVATTVWMRWCFEPGAQFLELTRA